MNEGNAAPSEGIFPCSRKEATARRTSAREGKFPTNPGDFRLDGVAGSSAQFISVPPRLQAGARKRAFDEIGRGIELRIPPHVPLADFSGESLHVGGQFGAQRDVAGGERRGRRDIL